MRPFLAICLFAVISLQLTFRVTGYLQCIVKVYMHDKNVPADCGCVHFLTQAFDGKDPDAQLQQLTSTLKMQDYVPSLNSPVPGTPLLQSPVVYGVVSSQYRYKGLKNIFHPPCTISSLI
ncbi:hypothetical protein [Chitinophaga niabensis]|uniref:hypothetical protein n=1 Tax=Chitinophaga niabensis TaxID=536979 RepID=UPI0011612A66|nr:hypothetical protein [Chitinophaga niabensis]